MKVILVLLIGVCSALALVPPEAADENGLTKGKTCKYGGQLACTASCKAKHCDRGRCDENEDCICYDCRNATTSTDTESVKTRDKTCEYGGQLACTTKCKAQHCDRGRCNEKGDCVCYDCRKNFIEEEQQSVEGVETRDKTCQYGGQLACTGKCKAQHCDRGRCNEKNDCVCYDCHTTRPSPPETKDTTCKYLGQLGCTSKCKAQGCERGRCDSNGNCVCEGC